MLRINHSISIYVYIISALFAVVLLDVILLGDLIDIARPGEEVEVTGRLVDLLLI
jgi:hypothetical protein